MASSTMPNVVFIVGDNVGWGDIGCYGGLAPTPRIDALAGQGMRFKNYNVEAQCTPTRSAILTGRLPIRTGNCSVPLPGQGDYGLAPWEYTLGELFSDAGYATGAFGKWHVGDIEGRLPTDQGFDEWFGIKNTSDEAAYSAHPLFAEPVPRCRRSGRAWPVRRSRQSTSSTCGRGRCSTSRSRRGPPPSSPAAPRAARRSSPTSASPRCTRRCSTTPTSPASQVAASTPTRSPSSITAPARCSTPSTRPASPTTPSSSGPATTRPDERSRWAARTDRGAATSGPGSRAACARPGMVRWPGKIEAGVVTDEIVTAVDWLPTLASLVGESQRVPDDRPIDGVDASAFLLGRSSTSGRDHVIYFGSDGAPMSVKWRTMKVVFRYSESTSGPIIKPQWPLVFDLIDDPNEEWDLIEKRLDGAWVVGPVAQRLGALQQSMTQLPQRHAG